HLRASVPRHHEVGERLPRSVRARQLPLRRTTAALVALSLDMACGPRSTAVSTPPAALPGGTGSFAIVPAGPRRKLYLPVHAAGRVPSVAVVDVSAARAEAGGSATPALLTEIALGGTGRDYATATAGASTTVVAASTQSPLIWFIDPVTETVTGT